MSTAKDTPIETRGYIKFISITASNDDLYALSTDGDVFKYVKEVKGNKFLVWVKLTNYAIGLGCEE